MIPLVGIGCGRDDDPVFSAEDATVEPQSACEPSVKPGLSVGDSANAVFPLQIDVDGRALLDASGRPFLMQGDSPWSLIVQPRREDVDEYLADRAARGFNTLLVNLIEHLFADNAPANAYGDPPFTTEGDFSTPNEAYFEHVDFVLESAYQHRFLVLLAPSYVGFRDTAHGWYEEMVASGPAAMREYGRFVGERYRDLPNIVWVQGGDDNPPDRELIDALARGIAETDPDALQTAHAAPRSSPTEYWGDYSWLDLHNVYDNQESVYPPLIDAYLHSTRPYFLLEGAYENEYDADTRRLRTQAYYALLAGSTGQVFGNNPIWTFDAPGLWPEDTTWQEQLDSPGSTSMTHVGELFTSLPWWSLKPDLDGDFLADGIRSGLDRAVAAVSCNGSIGIVYVPSERTVTLDLTSIADEPMVRWFDPSSGTYSAIDKIPDSDGVLELQTPGPNAEGSPDWVIVATTS